MDMDQINFFLQHYNRQTDIQSLLRSGDTINQALNVKLSSVNPIQAPTYLKIIQQHGVR